MDRNLDYSEPSCAVLEVRSAVVCDNWLTPCFYDCLMFSAIVTEADMMIKSELSLEVFLDCRRYDS